MKDLWIEKHKKLIGWTLILGIVSFWSIGLIMAKILQMRGKF